ncbi:hypothetical protein J1P26_21825 [Neobacillus sp. MM2021_6]|uniref:hypothetical protein n=1 Tax=Bacillaceae TaxID=186817 RepID=UPI00140E8E73|nr:MULTISPECIES: hypothetical protein [Bacillaceae]MBO0962346.1 hypothetical protein [Neobacillus sp. MM2021_6]NHC20829.1 hypothetical protein [Bacillus sp. MM2020_4]
MAKKQENLKEEPELSEEKQEGKKKKYKMRDPKTQYADLSFTLAGEQEKELPENPSDFLLAYIKAGFIVEVE